MSGRDIGDVRVVISPYRICPLGAHIDHQVTSSSLVVFLLHVFDLRCSNLRFIILFESNLNCLLHLHAPLGKRYCGWL